MLKNSGPSNRSVESETYRTTIVHLSRIFRFPLATSAEPHVYSNIWLVGKRMQSSEAPTPHGQI